MRSQCSIVDSRCAITIVVRPCISSSSAAWISRSDSVSSAEVASSRIRIGASFRIARAIAIRWRWPPESRIPRSPTTVSKPLRLQSDELQRVRGLGRALDRLSARPPSSVRDVRGDRVVEQDDLLAHQRDLAPQVDEADVREVLPVEQHAPFARHVEARDQVDERRLAAARRPDQRHGFARRDVEVEVGERGATVFRVALGHVLEADAALRASQRDGAGIGFRLLGDQPEDALGRGQSALDHRAHVGQRLRLIEQVQEGEHVGDEIARAVGSGGALPDRDPQDDGYGDRDDDLVDRRAERCGRRPASPSRAAGGSTPHGAGCSRTARRRTP